LPGTSLKVFGGWVVLVVVVVSGNFSVLFWSKTGILYLNSEFDQAKKLSTAINNL
jgi:hypothetical protein